MEYYGEVEINMPYGEIYQSKYKGWNAYWASYRFKSEAKVYEEYLICDTIGMIGSVGGTIGLFI